MNERCIIAWSRTFASAQVFALSRTRSISSAVVFLSTTFEHMNSWAYILTYSFPPTTFLELNLLRVSVYMTQ